jgi:hypothetical protein
MQGRPIPNDRVSFAIIQYTTQRLKDAGISEGSYSVKDHGEAGVEIGFPASLHQAVRYVVKEAYEKLGQRRVVITQGFHSPGAIGEGHFLLIRDIVPTKVVRRATFD